MKQLALILAVCLLLTGLAGCTKTQPPVQTQPSTEAQTPTQAPTHTPTEASTEASTEAPTEAPTETPTETPTTPAVNGPQPMDLVGTWKRTYTEVEGDRNKNTKATLTITGDSKDNLKVTYKDKEFPDNNFKNKALTVKDGELYPDCGSKWFADAANTGKYEYSLTLLEDGSLMLQCGFEIDGIPMVSYQWFARSK